MKTCNNILTMFTSTVFLLSKSTFGKENVKEAFEKAKIVPDVITEAPGEKALVEFKSGIEADLGNNLTPTQVNDEPKVKWNAEAGSFYTVAMVDPDAPTPQNTSYSEIRHWLVINIPNGNVGQGKVITNYFGAKPRKGSDPHRNIILVYKQKRMLILDPDNKSKKDFSIRDFAIMNGLGYPVSGNFFLASYDGSYDKPAPV